MPKICLKSYIKLKIFLAKICLGALLLRTEHSIAISARIPCNHGGKNALMSFCEVLQARKISIRTLKSFKQAFCSSQRLVQGVACQTLAIPCK